MADELQGFLDSAVAAAREAGRLIRTAFTQDHVVMNKGVETDLVTKTDQEAERIIIASLRRQYPTHCFIGEESTAAGDKTPLTDMPTWIIDPLDGTCNFVHGFPFVAVCIALAIGRVVQVGVVYNCIADEMYTAIQSRGAFKNRVPIKVSGCSDMHKAMLATEWGSDRTASRVKKVSDNMHSFAAWPCHSIRSLGAAALNMCMVACGSLDGYWEFGIYAWDYAAASVIVQEAGGCVCDTTGHALDLMARKVIAAASPALANDIAAHLVQIDTPAQ
jgi:myo-inositol-1(or 4)-monophosphatase